MSPQSAVGSLVFFTSALSTASTFHQVFTRSNKPRALSVGSAPPSPVISPQKSSRGRFRWFKAKRKFSKYTPPPTAVHPHDDDRSSICSEPDMYLGKRRTLSVPDLPNWNYSPISASQSTFVHTSLDETLQEEDEEIEDWDSMIAAEEQNSSNLFSRRPSLPPIPFSFPLTRGKAEKRRHNRCKSLPQIPMQDLPDSLYRKPKQRESWDAFYVIETPEIPVPEVVEESQIFIRMDMFNILDFNSQIKALETLRQQKRTLTESIQPASRCLGNTLRSHTNTELCYDTLEAKYQSYWEEADVILDLSDVAEDQTHIFGGNRSTHVIERTPSERHFHVLKNIIKSELGNDASKVIHQSKEDDDMMEDIIINDDDSDKENKSFDEEKVDEKKRRRERLRISVDMVPCLIGRLKKLREILSENIKELTVLAQAEGCGVECIRTDDGNLIAS